MNVVILTMVFSAQQLKKKILRDKYNSLVFEKGRGRGSEIYLVGGYIRDILMGIRSKDRDYIINGDIRSFVKEIRDITGGTIVELRKEHMIRIALNVGITLDFSKPMGTIEKDLSKRDFTINAIAWSPETGILDIYNGGKDIKQGKISSLSDINLCADPLRMLRAYRFAGELDGYIEKETRKSIKSLHKRIKKVSSERITLELFNLLNLKHSAKYLKMALLDGLLSDILPINIKVLENNVKEISKFETISKNYSLKIQVLLKKIFSQDIDYKGLICLELLLHNNGSAKTETFSKINISNKIRKRIDLSNKGIVEYKEKGQDKLFDVFSVSKEAAIDVLIILGKVELLKEYERFRRIWKRGVVSSEEVMNATGVKTGPKIGVMINEVKRAQFEGRIKRRRDAIKLLKSNI